MDYTVPQSLKTLRNVLAPLDDFWRHWGFAPWNMGPFTGVSRMQHFVKDGFLARIAEYRAWDYIIWDSGTEKDRENLWRTIRPLEDVMTQRFLFLVAEPWTIRRIKSFYAGLRGYAEFYAYLPTADGGLGSTEIKDLTGLIDMGLRLGLTRRTTG